MTGASWAGVVCVGVVLAWVVVLNVGRVRRLDRLHRRLDATRIGLAAALATRWDVAERVAARSAERDRAAGSQSAGPADSGGRGGAGGPGPAGLARSAERERAGLVGSVGRAGPEGRWARSAERGGPLGTGPAERGAGPGEPTPERSAERDWVLIAAVAAARSAGPDREPAENALGRALAAVDRSGLPDGLSEALVEAEVRLALARRVHNDAVRDTLALRSRRLVRLLHLAGAAPMPAYFEIADPPGVGC